MKTTIPHSAAAEVHAAIEKKQETVTERDYSVAIVVTVVLTVFGSIIAAVVFFGTSIN